VIERVPFTSDDDLQRRVARDAPFIVTGLTAGWPACSIEGLRRFADERVVVARARDRRLYVQAAGGIPQEQMRVGDFLDGLAAGDTEHYLITPVLETLPGLLAGVPLPRVVREASFTTIRLWVGGAGFHTPLHHDLPDNLYVQVQGRKRVTLIHRRHRRDVYPYGLSSGVPNFAQVDADHPDLERFPRFSRVSPLTCEVRAGEVLFIPRRWWHQLESLEASMSLSLWFANGGGALLGRMSHSYAKLRKLRLSRP